MVNILSRKIRYAEEPNNTGLITQYLNLGSEGGLGGGQSLFIYRQCREEQFKLLLDAVADECLPVYWRQLCLDHIHQPLYALWRVSDCDDSQRRVRQLFTELRVMGKYLEPSLSN